MNTYIYTHRLSILKKMCFILCIMFGLAPMMNAQNGCFCSISCTDNPEFDAECESVKVILILDESGSIGTANAESDVENATLAFLNGFNNTGAEVAIVDFADFADIIFPYTVVNDAFISDVTTYLTCDDDNINNNCDTEGSYNPSGRTNWEDALINAVTLNVGTQADLIVFMTDGNPNETICNNCGTAVEAACDEANSLKLSGAHILAVGVGNNISTANLITLTGNEIYDGTNFGSADYSLTEDFDNLENDIKAFAVEICGTDLHVEKTVEECYTIVNGDPQVEFTIMVTNLGTPNGRDADNVVVTDQIESGYIYVNAMSNVGDISFDNTEKIVTWNNFNLGVDEEQFITITVEVLPGGVKDNVGVATADNALSIADAEVITPVFDGEAPEIVDVDDYTLPGCNEDWPEELTTTWTDNIAAGGDLISDMGVDGDITGCTETRIYTFEVSDDCGNMSMETTTVSRIVDNEGPEITPIQDFSIDGCNTEWPLVEFSWTDDCGVDGEPAGTTTAIAGTPTRIECTEYLLFTVIILDDCGNETQEEVEVSRFVDDEIPVITCPTAIVDLGCNSAAPTIADALNEVTTSDECGIASIIATPGVVMGDCARVQIFTVEVTDNCDKTNNCEVRFSWTDGGQVTVICPQELTLAGCDIESQEALNTAFEDWKAEFVVNNAGCGAIGVLSGLPETLDYCDVRTDGIILTGVYTADDGCTDAECSSSFIVTGSNIVEVSCPNEISEISCTYIDQADLTSAYDEWVASFVVESAGCGAIGVFDVVLPESLDFCEVSTNGINIVVNFTADDGCTDATCMSTFVVEGATTFSVNCASPVELPSCSTEAEISAAYDLWVAEFSYSGGCNAGETSTAPALPSFACGEEVNLSYEYIVNDDCAQEMCTSTFKVVASTPLSVECPNALELPSCSTEAEIFAAYNLWVAEFSYSGGCTAGETSSAPALPDFACGEAIVLNYNYIVTDDCGSKDCTSTFSVAASTPLSVICPDDVTLPEDATEAEITTAYEDWIAGFSNSNGCNAGDASAAPALPSFDCGSGVDLTYVYSVTDDCGTEMCTSTFMVAGATALTINCPVAAELPSCSTDSEISNAYTLWIGEFGFTNGINAVVTSTAPSLPNFACGMGVDLSYEYIVSDDCGTQMCTSTFSVAPSTPLSVVCPSAVELPSCSTENEITAAYDNWIAGFSNADGCNAGDPNVAPELPDFVCGTAIELTYAYSVTDDCGTQTCTSTFSVVATTPLSVTCPTDVALPDDATELEITTAYNDWIAGFTNANGCNAGSPSVAPELPAFNCGSGVDLTYEYSVSDDCGTESCTSTFKVDGAEALTVSCPDAEELASCSTEVEILTAYNAWLSEFGFINGINASVTSTAPSLPNFACGEEVELSYEYEVTDDCGVQSCTSTFRVVASTPLSVSCPAPVELPSCSTEIEISNAYDTWIAGFSNSDGCNAGAPNGAPELPDFVCGVAIELTYEYAVSDDCTTKTCTSTFGVLASAPLSVSCPAPVELPSCSTEIEISDAYNTWIVGFSNANGCNAGSPNAPPELPDFACGEALELTYAYSVTDDCGTESCTSTFKVVASTPLSVSCPNAVSLPDDATEEEIIAEYDVWIAGFSNSNGCNPGAPSTAPELPSFACGSGVDLTYEYSVTDDCGTEICTSTFKVEGAIALSVSCPDAREMPSCSTANEISTAYDAWLTEFGFTNGINANVTSIAPSLPNFACGEGVDLSYEYEVTDDCGSKTCTSTFVVIASTPLSVSCPAPVELPSCSTESEINAGYNAWVAAFSNADGCNAGAPNAAPELPEFVCGTAIELTYTYSVTDDCETETCTSTFMVLASTPLSVACPSDVSLPDDATESEIVAAFNTWVAGFSNSGGCNAGAPSAAPELPPFNCGAGVDLSYEYNVSDDCGMQSCTSTFKVTGATPLTVECPDPVELPSCSTESEILLAYNTWLSEFQFSNGINASVSSTEPTLSNFACGELVELSYDYEVTDDCGSKTCTSTFSVAASTPLSVSCPASVDLPSCSTESEITAAYTTWIAGFSNSDGCNAGSPSAAPELSVFECGEAVELTYAYSVTDDCGTQTCTSTFSVAASTPLSVSCPSPVELPSCSTESEILDAYVAWLAAFTNSDGCNAGIPSVAPMLTDFVCGESIQLTYLYSVTDDCGTESCTSTFTVASSIPLSVSCPTPVSLDEDATELEIMAAYDDWIAGFSSSDGCNPGEANAAPELPEFVCGSGVDLTYEYSITDDCNTASCTSTFTVAGATALNVSCPEAVELPTCSTESEISDAYNTWLSEFTFSNGINANIISVPPALPSYSCGTEIDLSYEYIVLDACGQQSCTSTFKVAASTPLSLNCPEPMNMPSCMTSSELTSAYEAWIAEFTHADGCNSNVTSLPPSLPEYVCGEAIMLEYEYTVEDHCGTETCTSTFTVEATEPLMVSCPEDFDVAPCDFQDLASLNQVYQDWLAEFQITSGGCNSEGGFTTAVPAEVSFCKDTAIVLTYQYIDLCGMQECTSTFTIDGDETPPTIAFVNPMLIEVGNGGTMKIQCQGQDPNWSLPQPSLMDVEGSDECESEVDISFNEIDLAEGDCEADGYIQRYRCTWIVTDLCGNQDSLFIFMEVVDELPPQIVGVPGDVTVSCENIPDIATVQAIDECLCADVDVSESFISNECFDGQVIERVYVATDCCGNVTTQTQLITLVDDVAPEIFLTMPDGTTRTEDFTIRYDCNGSGIPSSIFELDEDDITAFELCSGLPFIKLFKDANLSPICRDGLLETYTFEWVVSDACYNESTITMTLEVTDTIPPVILNLEERICFSEIDSVNVFAVDACGTAITSHYTYEVDGPCGRELIRVYEAYDACGNFSEAEQRIVLEDTIAPELILVGEALDGLSFGDTIDLDWKSGSTDKITDFLSSDVVFSDECGFALDTMFNEEIVVEFDCSETKIRAIVEISWLAADACGNQGEFKIFARMKDEEAPILVEFNEEVFVNCGDPIRDIVVYDNSGTVDLQVDEETIEGVCPGTYDLIRTIVATDGCDNVTRAEQVVHVVDETGPVFQGLEKVVCADSEFPEVSAYDGCSGEFVDVTVVTDTIVRGSCDLGQVIKRTWMASDVCGNQSVFEQYIKSDIEVQPKVFYSNRIRPYIGKSTIVNMSDEKAMLVVQQLNQSDVYSLDLCIDIEIPSEYDMVKETAVNCMEAGWYQKMTYSWEFVDACGNISTEQLEIIVNDDIAPPLVNIPANLDFGCSSIPNLGSLDPPTFGLLQDSMTGSITFTEVEEIDYNVQTIFNVWTATDLCGNETEAIQEVSGLLFSDLSCAIQAPNTIHCNSHGNQFTANVESGEGPYTYEWKIEGKDCQIQGGQGTPSIKVYIGFSKFAISLTVTDAIGCVTYCETILDCNGKGEVDPRELISDLDIFSVGNPMPNPTNGDIRFSLNTPDSQNISYDILNVMNEKVQRNNTTVAAGNSQLTLRTADLASGVYYIRVENGKQSIVKKFIKIN